MRMIEADIGNSGELHRLYLEFARDVGEREPKPEIWLRKFTDPTFFCLIAKHGKRPVGFIMGRTCPYYEKPIARVEAVFVRRGFRGNFKFIRKLVQGGRAFLAELKIDTISYSRTKAKEKRYNGQ